MPSDCITYFNTYSLLYLKFDLVITTHSLTIIALYDT